MSTLRDPSPHEHRQLVCEIFYVRESRYLVDAEVEHARITDNAIIEVDSEANVDHSPGEISAEVVAEVLDVVELQSTGADTLAQADKVARNGRVEKRRKAQSKHLEREAVEREEVETATDVVDAAVKRDSEEVELVAHSVVDNDEVTVSETVTEAGLTLPPTDVEFWSPHARFRCRSHPYLVLFPVCVLVSGVFFFKCRVWACRCLSRCLSL